MKAISLWQPWASLVAVGAKTIETRSWSTRYRGPLAIHAAKRVPDHAAVGDFTIGRLDPGQPRRMWKHTIHSPIVELPLGAIVATATLLDVLPIVRDDECCWETCGGEHPLAHAAIDGQVIWHREGGGCHTTVLVEEAYGDYTPGRFAWLLTDIAPLEEPMPAVGRQGLWTWDSGGVLARTGSGHAD